MVKWNRRVADLFIENRMIFVLTLTYTTKRFIIKLLGNTKHSIKIWICGCMFLVPHHRQVFHESLVIYEIHYKNMHNDNFLKEGIRRK